MATMRLGRTNLVVNSVGFGVLPLQRIEMTEAVRILRRAHDAGINFYDTARSYSDSEDKLGAAFAGVRDSVIIASKTMAETGEAVASLLDESLRRLKTDYLDLLQIHNPSSVPVPGDGTGRYEAMLAAKKAGKTRFLGLTAHALPRAVAAVQSGLYDTVQFPFSIIATDDEIALAALSKTHDVGFIAMKGLGGGLISNIPAAFSFIRKHDNVLPIWGIQHMHELEEFLALDANPPAWDAAMEAAAQKERAALGGSFCRSCGYCMPCTVEIPIPMAARMQLFMTRSPWNRMATDEWQEKMSRIHNCTHCGECMSRCPYQLNIPDLLAENLAWYEKFIAGKKAAGEI